MWFHSEQERNRRDDAYFDPRRPDTLIYADLPGHPLSLVGFMFSMPRGLEAGSPGGPITRWHWHVVCANAVQRGTKPLADGSCPPGTRLYGGSEMLHVWFTGDLRSAYAIHAPVPELCAGEARAARGVQTRPPRARHVATARRCSACARPPSASGRARRAAARRAAGAGRRCRTARRDMSGRCRRRRRSRCRPLDPNATAVTAGRCPRRKSCGVPASIRRPVTVCQMPTVVGPAVAIHRPSELKLTSLTMPDGSRSRRSGSRVRAFQVRASPSRLDVTSSLPSGL